MSLVTTTQIVKQIHVADIKGEVSFFYFISVSHAVRRNHRCISCGSFVHSKHSLPCHRFNICSIASRFTSSILPYIYLFITGQAALLMCPGKKKEFTRFTSTYNYSSNDYNNVAGGGGGGGGGWSPPCDFLIVNSKKDRDTLMHLSMLSPTYPLPGVVGERAHGDLTF